MVNRPKQRGTAAETAVVKWARQNGWPNAERLTLTGSHDRGDIALTPGRSIVVEVKAVAAGATGQPGPALLEQWMAQTETERRNAGAAYAILVVKRKGTTDVGRWWAYLTLAMTAGLLDAQRFPRAAMRAPACLSVEAAFELLKVADADMRSGGVPPGRFPDASRAQGGAA